MSEGGERAAWRFLGLAALFVLAFVGLIALGTLLSPGNGWWTGPLGAGAVFVLYLAWRRGERDHGDGSGPSRL